MEKLAALVNKESKRVESVIVLSNESDIDHFANDKLDAILVPQSQSAFVYGIYDGEEFFAPEDDYLIQLGLVKPSPVEADE